MFESKVTALDIIFIAALCTTIAILAGCGDDITLPSGSGPTPGPVPTPTPEPTPEPASNPLCQGTMGVDGGGGFLWKPEGDNFKTLVVLLPGKFKSEFNGAYVTRQDGTVEQLRYTGFSNFDQDGERQTYRGVLRGGKYKGDVLAIGGNPSQECKWKVSRPGQRQD